ncbi:hypothetical protein [Pseudoduganella albidiflava]|uniref:Uncharacterized protein n=1 Tax=Pseudoduganella albidiflava TaxID=321983 RepID=A0A411X2X0_9BURK|nr:hypothetical protein [Pseudoduganella albidiflava]QBI03284.1 hypothetical protein EYF70_22490 [Pseudoduganella albidiflava]GGY68095.1 hypothetical protein GCM10007387_57850 [Pseudoduganella albidiflava]
MSNILLGFPNRADTATFNFGSWVAGLPISNVGKREQWIVARSVDTALASTRFQVDFGRVCNLRAFALANHNLSINASWRVQVGTTPGAADIYESGFQAVWGMTFDGDLLEWESASYWEGAIDDPAEYAGYPYLAVHALPTWLNARYVTISIDDTTNPAGYVQIGRLFAGGGFQPRYNASYGLKHYWMDGTELTKTASGYPLGTVKRRRRGASFVLDWLTKTEAATVHEIQRRQGLWGEVLYLPDPADQAECQRYGMLGHMAELGPIAYPYPRTHSVPFAIEEL